MPFPPTPMIFSFPDNKTCIQWIASIYFSNLLMDIMHTNPLQPCETLPVIHFLLNTAVYANELHHI